TVRAVREHGDAVRRPTGHAVPRRVVLAVHAAGPAAEGPTLDPVRESARAEDGRVVIGTRVDTVAIVAAGVDTGEGPRGLHPDAGVPGPVPGESEEVRRYRDARARS